MKNVFLYLVALTIVLSGIQSLSAQERTACSITAVLSDSVSSEPLSYANVAILKASDSAFIRGSSADFNGSFTVQGIPDGDFLLRVSYMGYDPPLIPFSVKPNEKKLDLGKIRLKKNALSIEGVEITERKPMYEYKADKKVYNVGEDAGVQNGVASDALQNAPGVWVDLEGNITLRGVPNVQIWINDKPSKLSAEGLKNYLQQLPANALDRIEVITNPSAKYGASGTGGIINIITKQKISRNYFLSLGLTANTKPELRPWLSLVWSNEQFKFSAYANYSNSKWDGSGGSEGALFNGSDTLYTFSSLYDSKYDYRWIYGHLNAEYSPGKKDVIEVYAGGSISGSNSSYNDSTWKDEKFFSRIYTIEEISRGNSEGNSLYAGCGWNHDFNDKGHNLNIDMYGYFWGYESDNREVRVYAPSFYKSKLRHVEYLSDSRWLNMSARYTLPFNEESSLEAGFSGSVGLSGEDKIMDTLDTETGEYLYAAFFSNSKDKDGRSADLYATYSGKLWKFEYKIGLRSEYRYTFLNSFSTGISFTKEYFNLYPSAYLSLKTGKTSGLSLSYSRRVDYPDYQLDPYVDRTGDEYIWGGNPDLKPAYTNSYELGFSKYFVKGGSLTTSLYHRSTKRDISDVMNRVYDTLLNRYMIYGTYANSGTNAFTGAELSLVYRPLKYLNLILNGNLYHSYIRADVGSYSIEKEKFDWDVKLTPSLTIAKKYVFQLTGVYRSPSNNLMGSRNEEYFLNAMLRADFLNRKLSLSLGVQDIFNWLDQGSETKTPELYTVSNSKYVTRFATFGLTFRFGKIELEREVKTGQGPAVK